MFKRKGGNPVFLAGCLTAGLALLWVDKGAAQQTTIGKYLCVVDHVAGLQFGNGGTTAGQFRPNPDRFFLTIRNARPMAGCPNLFAPHSLMNWFSCEATTEAQMDGGPLLRGDSAFAFLGTGLADGAHLSFSADSGVFDSVSSVVMSGGILVSDGRCTKVA